MTKITQEQALTDNFDGDNAHLIRSIEALIALNDKGALAPHGIGGHARALLSSAAVRLTRPAPAPMPSREEVANMMYDLIKSDYMYRASLKIADAVLELIRKTQESK